MSDATSTFTVRGRADVDDAVRGLGRVEDAADKVENANQGLGASFKAMTGALLTAEAAMQVLGAAAQFVSSSIQEAIAADEQLSAAAAVTTERVDGLQVAFGGLIVGGKDGAEAIWLLNDMLADLTEALNESGESGGIALTVIEALRSTIVGVTYIVDGATIAWGGFKTILDGIRTTVFAVATGVQGLSTALADLVVGTVGRAIEGFANLLESTVGLARALRAGGLLPEGVDGMIESMRQLGIETAANTDPMERLNESGRAIGAAFEQLSENTRETGASMWEQIGASQNLRDALYQTRERTEETTETTLRYAGAAREAAVATEAWAFEVDKFMSFDAGPMVDPKVQFNIEEGKIEEIRAFYAEALQVSRDGIEGLQATLTELGDAVNQVSPFAALGRGAQEMGGALADGLGAALSTTENFGKAFAAATGQALVSSGIQTLFEGLKALVPLPGLFNPAAAAVAIPLGGAMIGAGKLLGAAGGGGVPTGGGGGSASAPEQTGLKPVQTTQPDLNLVDYTGMTLGKSVTIVTNDVDSMRTFTDRQARTAQSGVGARV